MLLIDLLKAGIEGAWRRWFGGGASDYFESKGLQDDSTWYTKLLCSRGTQSFFNYIFLSLCFYYSFNIDNTILRWLPDNWQDYILEYGWILAIYNGIMFQCLYWSKGHGAMFDYGHGGYPAADTIKRYKEMWFTKYLDKCWDKYFGEQTKYTYFYDCLSMAIRYTYPCVIVALTAGWHILPLGIICTGCYAIMWGIYDHDNWLFNKLKAWYQAPTKVAEVLTGACVGFLI